MSVIVANNLVAKNASIFAAKVIAIGFITNIFSLPLGAGYRTGPLFTLAARRTRMSAHLLVKRVSLCFSFYSD